MKYAIALLVILLILWYLSFSATRLDRLHHRVETSWANLDSILQRRAALALEIGQLAEIDAASSLILTAEAHEAREADIAERSDAESGLSGALRLLDRKSTRLNSSHTDISRMPSSA